MELSLRDFIWTREPESCVITQDVVEIITRPHTDLWQRTYYHFRNDNALALRMELIECKWLAHDSQAPIEELN